MAQLAAWALAAASAGASQVTISEWDVPTANSRPHDPAATPDGALWFTEQMANKLGRLDPRSGRIREFPLKTPESGPHGLVVDRDGSVWFAAIFKATSAASIHGRARSPSTGSRTPTRRIRTRRCSSSTGSSGSRWSTRDRFLGRIDEATGKTQEWPSPGGPGSKPYGIAVMPDGAVWYSESGVTPNTLVRFDPRSKSFSTTAIPSGGGVVRNMVAFGDKLYLAESGVNKVAVAQVRR